jgi:hypothetical protein
VESGHITYAEDELRREQLGHIMRSAFLLGTLFGFLCLLALCFLAL